jgi:hypothetical protein
MSEDVRKHSKRESRTDDVLLDVEFVGILSVVFLRLRRRKDGKEKGERKEGRQLFLYSHSRTHPVVSPSSIKRRYDVESQHLE